MDIVGHQVLVGVDDKALVFQEGRGQVHLWRSAQEPLFHLVIIPPVDGIHDGQPLYEQPYPFWQLVEPGQPALVLLPHHHALIGTHRRLSQPKCQQGDAQRIIVGGRGHLHHAIDDVGVHLRSGIDRRTGLRGLVGLAVLVEHA